MATDSLDEAVARSRAAFGRLRCSFHLSTTMADVDRAIDLLTARVR
jgi:cysteine sulfinate desulfinase/cysteine desulfurase-like protein